MPIKPGMREVARTGTPLREVVVGETEAPRSGVGEGAGIVEIRWIDKIIR